MGTILFIVASIVKWLITPLAYSYSILRALSRVELNDYHKNLAVSKDIYGNCLCSYLFNDLLIKKSGYKFGNHKETISSVLGKNYSAQTLTRLGITVANILDFFDKNHVIKSIDNSIN